MAAKPSIKSASCEPSLNNGQAAQGGPPRQPATMTEEYEYEPVEPYDAPEPVRCEHGASWAT